MLKKQAPPPIQTGERAYLSLGDRAETGGEISGWQPLPRPKQQSGSAGQYLRSGGPLTSQVTSQQSLFVVEPVSLIPTGNRPEPRVWNR